jgi:spore coat polysaccharide biosynthesis protein SpsF
VKLGIIILARLSSTRLPRKALLPFGEGAVIDFIVDRVRRTTADDVVVATSDDPSDDDLVAHCRHKGYAFHRGSLSNVSQRFLSCMQYRNHDYSARINGDNVFTDANEIDKMLAIARTGQYDLISNVPGRTFPIGMSVEIVRSTFYAAAYGAFASDGDFEHVTSYLYAHEELGRRLVVTSDCPLGKGLRLALDTREDYARLSRLRDGLGKNAGTVALEELCQAAKGLQHAVGE